MAGGTGRRNVAVVLAAGQSLRFGGAAPKQSAPLAGAPLATHCLRAMQHASAVDEVLLVARKDAVSAMRAMVREHGLDKVAAVIEGGASRQESARMAVRHLERQPQPPAVVLVHDAARPLITAPFVNSVAQAAAEHGAAVPVLPCADTLKAGALDGTAEATLPRPEQGGGLHRAQTPQGFAWEALRAAHAQERGEFTDDAALVAAAGTPVRMIRGLRGNIKVTEQEDLMLAERLLHGGVAAGARWSHGIGYDAHRLAPPGPLTLGGVSVPSDAGLEGHSDGDVLLHSVADAVLGAAGLGDLGRHFPAEPRWKDADSAELLALCAAKARALGWVPEGVAATVMAARPRLADHLQLMEERVAEVLGMERARVNIAATTTDGLGVIEAGGIAAQAAVTMRRIGMTGAAEE